MSSSEWTARLKTPVLLTGGTGFLGSRMVERLTAGGFPFLAPIRRELDLICPAEAIPGEIAVDLTGYDIGTSIHISQVTLPEGVRPTITDRDFTVASIVPPTVVADTGAAATTGEGEGA